MSKYFLERYLNLGEILKMDNNVDNSKKRSALVNAVTQVFSKMALIEVLNDDKPLESMKFEHFVSINMIEPFPGIINMHMSNDLKKVIVGNIWGDPNESDLENDCIKEILNILTGRFFVYYLGRQVQYKIDLPKNVGSDLFKNRTDFGRVFFSANIDSPDKIFKVEYRIVDKK